MSNFVNIPYLLYLFTLINITFVFLLTILWGKIFQVNQYRPEKIQPKYAVSIGGIKAMKEVKEVD